MSVSIATFALGLQSSVSVQAQAASSSAKQFLAAHPSLRIPEQANRVAAGASFANLTRASGHVAPFAASAPRLGSPAADEALGLTVLLTRTPELQAAMDQLAQDQQNASSPLYHQWLTPQQIGALFGPTQADVDALTAWLSSSGFKVESVDPTRTRIHFSTTFGRAASVFQTSFANFQVGSDVLFSATEEPSLPAALTPIIGSIQGLSRIRVYRNLRRASIGQVDATTVFGSAEKPQFTYSKSGAHYLAPADFNTIYDVPFSPTAGAGQRIAVIGQSRVYPSDLANYEAAFGLPNTVANLVIPSNGNDPGYTSINSDRGEQTLDVERVVGTAPGATLDLVVSGDVTNNSGLGVALDWNVNTLLDSIQSISYGSCEADYTAHDAVSDDQYFQQASIEGITTLISSGDEGVQACSGLSKANANAVSINGLCGSSYVTCVGGTEFAETSSSSWSATNDPTTKGSATGYIAEGAWNDPSYTDSNGATVYELAATGGGASQFIAKPVWQTAAGVPADGKRDVPDVSFTSSANHDGYLLCLTASGTACSSYSVFGGTSAAAPGMAGIVALLNQKAGLASGKGSGNINPLLYALYASNPSTFHDVTVASSGVGACTATSPSMCNNSTPTTTSSTGVTGFTIGSGYDLPTGLGSLDVNSFIKAASPATSNAPSFLLAPSSGTLSFTSGATTGNGETITVTSTNGFSGPVTLRCSLSSTTAYYQPTCTVSPGTVTLTSGGSGTAIVTIGSTTAIVTTTQAVKGTLSQLSTGGALLALLGFCVPLRRRRALRSLATMLLMASGLAALAGCGQGGSLPSTTTTHSSAGTYTVTVTGTGTTAGSSTAATASTTFTVTIN